jgi:hypothetical protein
MLNVEWRMQKEDVGCSATVGGGMGADCPGLVAHVYQSCSALQTGCELW